MIEYTTGDLLSMSPEDVDALVIPVNGIGKLDGGSMVEQFARRAKKIQDTRAGKKGGEKIVRKFGSAVTHYEMLCKDDKLVPGEIHAGSMVFDEDLPGGLILAVTTGDPAEGSKIEWIESIAKQILDKCKEMGWTRVGMSLIGSGSSGKLNAKTVGRTINQVFKEDKDILVKLFVPMTILSPNQRKH